MRTIELQVLFKFPYLCAVKQKMTHMDINEKFAKAILVLRRNNDVKLTQRDIAEEADLTLRFYQYLELGQKKPSLETVDKIAHAYGMKLSDLCKIIEETD